jgi:cold-inducible RNA-binding protein
MYSDSGTEQGKKLYIGNLPFSIDDSSLREFFENALGAGTVKTAQVVIDKVKNRSKGFGFVVFTSDDAASKAVAMSGQDIQGPDGVIRKLSVDEARERSKNSNHSRSFSGRNNNSNSGGFGGGGNFNNYDGGGWNRKDNGRRGRGNNKKYDSDRW